MVYTFKKDIYMFFFVFFNIGISWHWLCVQFYLYCEKSHPQLSHSAWTNDKKRERKNQLGPQIKQFNSVQFSSIQYMK